MAKKECCAIISVLCSAEPVSVGHRSRSGRESMRHCRRNAFLSPDRHSSLQSDVAISDVNAEEFDFWYRHRRDVACCKSRCQLVGYWTNERIAGRPQCVPITIDWLYEESSDTWLGVRTKCHSRNERSIGLLRWKNSEWTTRSPVLPPLSVTPSPVWNVSCRQLTADSVFNPTIGICTVLLMMPL